MFIPVFYDNKISDKEELIMYRFSIVLFLTTLVMPFFDKDLLIFIPLSFAIMILSRHQKNKKIKEDSSKEHHLT